MSNILRYFYGLLTIRTWKPYFIWELLLSFYVYAAILYCLILYNSLFWLPACLKRYSLLKTTNPHFVVISMFDNLSICISARCTKSGFYHRPGTPCSRTWSDMIRFPRPCHQVISKNRGLPVGRGSGARSREWTADFREENFRFW